MPDQPSCCLIDGNIGILVVPFFELTGVMFDRLLNAVLQTVKTYQRKANDKDSSSEVIFEVVTLAELASADCHKDCPFLLLGLRLVFLYIFLKFGLVLLLLPIHILSFFKLQLVFLDVILHIIEVAVRLKEHQHSIGNTACYPLQYLHDLALLLAVRGNLQGNIATLVASSFVLPQEKGANFILLKMILLLEAVHKLQTSSIYELLLV